jgi:hypothetical protein
MSLTDPKTTALAVRDTSTDPWRALEWQRLWLSLQARPWTVLSLVPASSGASLRLTLSVAVGLARTGMSHLGVPIHVADATEIQLSEIASFNEEIARCRASGDRIMIALGPVEDSPAAESLARAADGTLLCVSMGTMSSSGTKKTVKVLGKERFVGSVIVDPAALDGLMPSK